MPRTSVLTQLVLVSLVLCLAFVGCQGTSTQTLVDRGRELTAGCHACHTPKIFTDAGPVPDTTRALSGHPQGSGIPEIDFEQVDEGWLSFNDHMTCWVGPWGVAFARNLTPDSDTGIGTWSKSDFMRVVRAGKHFGSDRALSQAMPWVNLGKSSQEDLDAIYAYLKSLPEIKNRVPDAIPLEKLKPE